MAIQRCLAFVVIYVAFLGDAGALAGFTKVSNAGEILPDSAQLGDGPDDWACTRDDSTGNMWEVKAASGIRAATHKYTWRSANTALGSDGNTASCGNSLSPETCNTLNYVAAVNDLALCGSTSWRMPLGAYVGGPAANSPLGELAVLYKNLTDSSGASVAEWFPTTASFWYWTDIQDPLNFGRVWGVNFGSGQVFGLFWDFAYHVKLVTTDSPTLPPPPPPPPPPPEPEPPADPPSADDRIFADSFERILKQDFNEFTSAALTDWFVVNLSFPQGDGLWTQGEETIFQAFEGPPNGYAAVDFTATTGSSGINSWYLSPEVQFRSGSRVVFYTRSANNISFPDRLEIRSCTGGCLQDFTVSTPPFDVGNYTNLIGSINPQLLPNDDPTGIVGYPSAWARFEFGPADGVPQSGFGRIGFRYFVTDGGPDGQNSSYIGLDAVRIEAVPVNVP